MGLSRAGAGPVFNPFGKAPGAPGDDNRRVGDLGTHPAARVSPFGGPQCALRLTWWRAVRGDSRPRLPPPATLITANSVAGAAGNIEANVSGVAKINMEDAQVKLIGPQSVIGRSVVVYHGPDDFGKVQPSVPTPRPCRGRLCRGRGVAAQPSRTPADAPGPDPTHRAATKTRRLRRRLAGESRPASSASRTSPCSCCGGRCSASAHISVIPDQASQLEGSASRGGQPPAHGIWQDRPIFFPLAVWPSEARRRSPRPSEHISVSVGARSPQREAYRGLLRLARGT